jgi:hypothetical protein
MASTTRAPVNQIKLAAYEVLGSTTFPDFQENQMRKLERFKKYFNCVYTYEGQQ